MNPCQSCRHHELVQLTNGEADFCYHPKLLVGDGSSLCAVNRAEGGACGEGQYFEERTKL